MTHVPSWLSYSSPKPEAEFSRLCGNRISYPERIGLLRLGRGVQRIWGGSESSQGRRGAGGWDWKSHKEETGPRHTHTQHPPSRALKMSMPPSGSVVNYPLPTHGEALTRGSSFAALGQPHGKGLPLADTRKCMTALCAPCRLPQGHRCPPMVHWVSVMSVMDSVWAPEKPCFALPWGC